MRRRTRRAGAAGAPSSTPRRPSSPTTAGALTVRRSRSGRCRQESGSQTVTYFIADLVLSDATVLRSAFAQDASGASIVDETSDIAEQNGAIFAVNGDDYGFRDTGIVIHNGLPTGTPEPAKGWRSTATDTSSSTARQPPTASRSSTRGVWNTLYSGRRWSPTVRSSGAPTTSRSTPTSATTPFRATSRVPRSVSSRTTISSWSWSTAGPRDTARALDDRARHPHAGPRRSHRLQPRRRGSSTLFFDGEVVNQPSDGGERGTSEILYIKG